MHTFLQISRINILQLEKITLYLILGAIFPILGFLAGWWGTFSIIPDTTFIFAFIGLFIGILLDITFLRKWVNHAYTLDLRIWMVIYLFYSVGMIGFFMGFPVFNVLLAIPAGLFIGSRLAHLAADHDEIKRLKRITCGFTTAVMAIICCFSATIALIDPYTSSGIQGMLGLPFEIMPWMLIGMITMGGISLLALQWVITGKCIQIAYTFMNRYL